MKQRGLGELCAATSDNQTDIKKKKKKKKTEFFFHSQTELHILSFQNTYKWDHGNQRPKIELVRAFMPVLITSNFDDDDSIKNKWASRETPFSHYKSMGNFLDFKGS